MSDSPSRAASAKSNLPKLAIAGGGIGGMALAIALKRRGFDPVVIEKRSAMQLGSEGIFLTLAPNGLNALRGLGLAEQVVAGGVVTTGIAMHNEQGKRLGLIDYAAHAEAYGAPSATVRRGVLGAVLRDAAVAEGVTLRLGATIAGVRETGDGVELAVDGETLRFDALIAADGLRSTVRRSLFPEAPAPEYSGLVGSGGVVDVAEVAPTNGLMLMTFGKRAFFGYIKAEGGPVYWFNSFPSPESAIERPSDPVAFARHLVDLHSDDPLDNLRIVSAETAIDRYYPDYDMPPLKRWSTPHVLLMGDAAHAVTPHSGQGASMALEDALVLAACLEAAPSPAAAFQRFELLRRDRVALAVQLGRQGGQQKKQQGWLALRIRDLMLPLVLPLGQKAQERMFGFRADRTPLTQPVQ